MKVYSLKAYGRYGGGMAVVVARTPEEAAQVAGSTINDTSWHTNYAKPDSCAQLPVECDTDEPCVLDHFETGE